MGKIYDEHGRRWHLPALPTTLAKLESISTTTLARLLLQSQQRCKEVSSSTRSGKSQGEVPPPSIHAQPTPNARGIWQPIVDETGFHQLSGDRQGEVYDEPGRRKRPHHESCEIISL